jgi:hypothetical protein
LSSLSQVAYREFKNKPNWFRALSRGLADFPIRLTCLFIRCFCYVEKKERKEKSWDERDIYKISRLSTSSSSMTGNSNVINHKLPFLQSIYLFFGGKKLLLKHWVPFISCVLSLTQSTIFNVIYSCDDEKALIPKNFEPWKRRE